jgi:predicted MPP superfamily phosphohydrolase
MASIGTLILLCYGTWNAAHPRIKQLNLSVAKQAGSLKGLNIVMVSDIHLGSLFGKQKVARMVDRINNLQPDMILLVGDLLDEAQNPIFKNNTGDPLKMLHAPMGVYAVTGNHEYIGGINRAVHYIESLNIKLLRDTAILVDNSFYLAGREDRDINRFSDKGRKPLSEIVKSVNHTLPVILMDHQPFALNQAVENGIDLQLSGHTHHGQFWPINYLTNRIYEVSWGYKQKENTHIYVSCGYGTWGPPIRIGNQPEIVKIKLKFK